MTITFPDPSVTSQFTEGNTTYTWREEGQFWKAEVSLFDIEELDNNYVNIPGDVMDESEINNLDYPYDPGILQSGDEPGVKDDGTVFQFLGNVRVDALDKLESHNAIELYNITANNETYTSALTISGTTSFNQTVQVEQESVVRNTVGDVTRTYQWQVSETTSTINGDGTFTMVPPTTFTDIVGENTSKLKVRPSVLGVDPSESPVKLVFVRCVETITDSRGNTCGVNQSDPCGITVESRNYLGPFT